MRQFLSLAALLAFSALSSIAQTNHGFVATQPISIGGSPQASAVADLNHDGIPDIVVADGTSTTVDSSGVDHYAVQGIAVLLGKGGGAFRAAVKYPTSDSASFVAIADVDGDGNPDVITASYDPTIQNPGGSMQVLLGNGDGTFRAAVKYTVPGGGLIQAVYPGDFNGDGHIDLAVTTATLGNPLTQGLAIFLNNGNGTFRLGQQMTNVSPFGVADFNHDGKLDLAVANYSGWNVESVGILYGSGNGGFTPAGQPYPITFVSGTFPLLDIAIQDFNEDGYPDLAVVVNSTTLTILLTQPNGSFTRAPNPPSIDGGSSITAGDFNHDGHMDVAIVTGEEESQIDVLAGRGDGTFQYRTNYGTDGAWGFGPGGITASDLNKDGYPDLVSVNETGTVSLLYDRPGGTFNAEVNTGPGWMNSDATVAGDFNGDSIPDVAVLYSSTSAYQGNSTVSIYQGIGNGHFKTAGAHSTTGTTGLAFAAGDVNGDGKLDLVTGGLSTTGIPGASVLLGNGNGTFQPARTLGSQVCPLGTPEVFLADINNDGKLDLVTSDGVSFGDGTGAFGACVPFYTSQEGVGPVNIALGDFNHDGKLDLAFILGSDMEVEIHLGDGAGHFNPTASFSVNLPYSPNRGTFIRAGHFTKNGYLGLVVGTKEATVPLGNGSFQDQGHGEFSILGGNGDGTLMPPVTYQLPQDLLDLAVADFNGDGLDDVAALNDRSFNQELGVHSYLSLFTSKGDGGAQPEIDFGAGEMGFLVSGSATQQILSVADFNRDGAPDIAGLDLSALGLLLNSGGASAVLSASPNPVRAGQKLTLKAAVNPSSAFSGSVSNGGQVTFYDGSTKLGSADLYNGQAMLTTSSLSAGSHTLSAVYSGNANYAPRQSNSVMEVVSQ